MRSRVRWTNTATCRRLITLSITPEEYEKLEDKHGFEPVSDESNVISEYTKTNTTYLGDQLFVYGEEVDDFKHLQESAISALSTAALQEVDRIQQQHDAQITDLEAAVASRDQQIDEATQPTQYITLTVRIFESLNYYTFVEFDMDNYQVNMAATNCAALRKKYTKALPSGSDDFPVFVLSLLQLLATVGAGLSVWLLAWLWACGVTTSDTACSDKALGNGVAETRR